MKLFIPRKQNLTAIGKSTQVDGPHLEDALRENFLSIQNWANQRGVSAAVRGSTNETMGSNVFFQPSFDTKNWDYSSISSTSAQHFTVPEDGIYVLGVGATFTQIPGQTHLQVSINVGTYPRQDGFILGSTAATWTGMLGGSQQRFKQGQIITPAVLASMPGATDTCQVILNEFALTKLFDIPSKVQ